MEHFDKSGIKLKINDNRDIHYTLPNFVKNNIVKLLSSHKYSTIFNAVNIRLDSINIDDAQVSINTSRTNYFNSMVTNRAMDKELAKNTLGCSVAASLKTNYALDNNRNFNLSGLKNGIIKEIRDELFLEQDYDFDISKNIIAIYRDLVEGGKPQLLIYIKSKLDSKKIERNFKTRKQSKIKESKTLLRDGFELLFLEPNKIKPTVNSLIYEKTNGKKKIYPMVPSTSGSVALALQ